jgi:hypothetical protein
MATFTLIEPLGIEVDQREHTLSFINESHPCLTHPKGYNSLHSGLTTVYARTNHPQPAPPYPRTHWYDAVQSDAPTREPPHTQSLFAAASPHGA